MKPKLFPVFMITKVPDPLLCITVSTTLRNKPLAVTPPRMTLAARIDAAGGLKRELVTSPVKENGADHTAPYSDDEDLISGLQEVNLFEGLATGESYLQFLYPAMNTTHHSFQGRRSRIHKNDSPFLPPV